ncbi:MAG: MFS transporter [Hyphomicrobiaceae bacterium]
MTEALAGTAVDDRLARRNAIVLAIAQACYGIAVSLVITLGGVVGHALAVDKSLSTLPITTMMIGTTIGVIPASLFMQRFGRRAGFMLGALSGVTGGLLAAQAIFAGSFWLFCLATHFLGYYQATAGYYRFAAADTASLAFRPKAISYALGGGLAGAVLTPVIVQLTNDVYVLSAACFLAAAGSALAGCLVLTLLRIPKPVARARGASSGRPLLEIMRQPRFLAAMAAGAVSYGMMSLVMTSTPLAMIACGFDNIDAAGAIRWHVVAMYLPSFFAGHLIARFGREQIALVGMAILLLCGLVALMGLSFLHFTVAMVALGAGWNLAYVSATSIVADSHTPEERGKVQAANDFVIFSFVAFCSFMSGVLLNHVGWNGINVALFPAIGLAAVLVLVLPRLKVAPAT